MQWYLIAEDQTLSLRLVTGAMICVGDDGELTVSSRLAAHVAEFEIAAGQLWLLSTIGLIRADGRLVTDRVRIEAGAQLQIGTSRFFVADSVDERMPDIPILEDRLDGNDYRLPKPGGRRGLAVRSSTPLDLGEIIIPETAAASREAGTYPTAITPDDPAEPHATPH